MAALTLTANQRAELAEKLGLDPWTMTPERIAQRVEQMQDRAARSFADSDPTGILKLDRVVAAPVETSPRTTDEGDVALDAAVGRGAVAIEDRAAWRRRYERAPETIREILDELPGDPAQAERAFEQDERIRSLADQFDDYMGVPEADRVRAYAEPDDGLPHDPTGILR